MGTPQFRMLLHFLDAFWNGDFSELAVWPSKLDLITGLLRILCLTRSTLKLVGLPSLLCPP